ncbi:MAG: biotin--[acetyl-CoA-carboxylase] ligase [Bacteroidales bacterium]
MKIKLQEIDSTNSYLRSLSQEKDVEEGTLVWSASQTRGRGQRGNFWESEPDKNLTFSLILYPDFLHARDQFYLSELVAVSLATELLKFDEEITIKWPNDIYWREKKIAGILIENDLLADHLSKCIIGIGLNVNQTEFRSDAPNPVSLKQITGLHCDLESLLDRIASRIYTNYLNLISEGPVALHDKYMHYLYRREGYHSYRDDQGEFRARILSVQSSGHLQLKTDSGETRVYGFKEVEFLHQ